METVAVFGVLAFFVILTIALGVRIVPQGYKHVVQRFGKFHRTLNPGLNMIIPYIDSVAYKVTTKDIVLDVPSQDVITRDNVVIIANAVAYINVLNPERAVYGVEDYAVAIQTLVQTSLRSIIGEMDMDDALSSRDQIKARLLAAISDDVSEWGVTVKTVEIQDISPSSTMQRAMEEQAAAERQRRATVTRANGEKEAAILEAEGRLEASRRDAEAKKVLADASREAISMVAESIQDKELPVIFLLGERYVDALKGLAQSANAKTVLLPGDLQASLRALFGSRK
ncbi:MAG: SPFH domain-containing protein [Thiohalomonadaceae bacterium]